MFCQIASKIHLVKFYRRDLLKLISKNLKYSSTTIIQNVGNVKSFFLNIFSPTVIVFRSYFDIQDIFFAIFQVTHACKIARFLYDKHPSLADFIDSSFLSSAVQQYYRSSLWVGEMKARAMWKSSITTSSFVYAMTTGKTKKLLSFAECSATGKMLLSE